MHRLAALTILMAMQGAATQDDPNAPAAPRRPLSFRVFNNMDKPVTGRWSLEVPGWPARPLEIVEQLAGRGDELLGLDLETREEILRLQRKKEGIGYSGEMKKVFGACGLEALAVSEFLPLGDSIVLRFETPPPSIACPPLDGEAGRWRAWSPRGGSVRLRDASEISSPSVRDEYSIGGDRQVTESTSFALGGVTLDPGSDVRLRQRMKAPLDGSMWFEVEAVVSAEAGVDPPRGFLRAESLRLVGSLSLSRLAP